MQIGTGILGWTEQQTLDTSIPTILLAYEGRIELLQPPPAEQSAMAAENVFAMFRAAAR